jgi:MFS family permease
MKYLIIAFSCFIIEIASTMYISTVSDNSPYMLLWAFIGPFLGLPFIGYIVDEKKWTGRLKIAFASAIGYVIGALVVFLIKN